MRYAASPHWLGLHHARGREISDEHGRAHDRSAPDFRSSGVDVRTGAWLVVLLATVAAGIFALTSRTIAPASRTAPPPVSSSSGSWLQVPVLAQLAISRALGRSTTVRYWARSVGSSVVMENARQRLSARFSATGLAVSDPAGALDLRLHGIAGVPSMAVQPMAAPTSLCAGPSPVVCQRPDGTRARLPRRSTRRSAQLERSPSRLVSAARCELACRPAVVVSR